MPFSQEYLKDYEQQIRQLPLDELYDILGQIRNHPLHADNSPERVQIVEKRIQELNDNPDSLLTSVELNDKLESEFKKTAHPKSFFLRLFGCILLFLTFAPYTRNGDPCINFRFLQAGVSLFLLTASYLIDKRANIRGGAIHKEALPFIYWCYITLLFATGVFCFFSGFSL